MIPFIRLELADESIELANNVLKSGQLAQGKYVDELEYKFAEYCGVSHAVAVSSGTAALHLALLALGIKEGDEVITTPFTFGSTASSILMCGARPVFVDIEEDTFLMNPELIEDKVTYRSGAIIPVDIFGRLADYDRINEFALDHDLKVVEDACQAVGAMSDGNRAGTFGDIGVFSLYATKNLCAGEGGIIVTDDERLADRFRILRNHGQAGRERYDYQELGYNYRLTDLSAAVALPQLETIEEMNQKRLENAEFYNEALAGINGLKLPGIDEKRSVFHLYTMRVTEEFRMNRDELKDHLAVEGIETAVYYPKPLHLYPLYRKFGYKEGDFPVAEKACAEVLSLPIHPLLKREDLEKVVQTISSI